VTLRAVVGTVRSIKILVSRERGLTFQFAIAFHAAGMGFFLADTVQHSTPWRQSQIVDTIFRFAVAAAIMTYSSIDQMKPN
jgi:hypothetical protein